MRTSEHPDNPLRQPIESGYAHGREEGLREWQGSGTGMGWHGERHGHGDGTGNGTGMGARAARGAARAWGKDAFVMRIEKGKEEETRSQDMPPPKMGVPGARTQWSEYRLTNITLEEIKIWALFSANPFFSPLKARYPLRGISARLTNYLLTGSKSATKAPYYE